LSRILFRYKNPKQEDTVEVSVLLVAVTLAVDVAVGGIASAVSTTVSLDFSNRLQGN
jgi:hypothetical protein